MPLKPLLPALLLAAFCARPAHAYVDLSPTIAKVISDSRSIVLVELVSLDKDTRTATFKERLVLKGDPGAAPLTHRLAEADTALIPRSILQWSQPGAQAVIFSTQRTAIVCIGRSWYGLKPSPAKTWSLGLDRPDLSMTYYGSIPRLTSALQSLLAGRDAVITTVPHGDDQNVGFDLALNRMAYPALVPLQRIRANLSMPGVVMLVSNNPAYVLGPGPLAPEELPALLAQLQSPNSDPASRAAALEDLYALTHSLGTAATRSALPALEHSLADASPHVRTLAAGTLLRLSPSHAPALRLLTDALASPDPLIRRHAATAAAFTAKAGAGIVPALAKLLTDADEPVRFAALEALATLGPVSLPAREALIPLLDSPDTQSLAADALGRLGPRAQPVPPALLKLLDDPHASVRLAALRGLCQIGGKEALPAAQYIARELPNAAVIDAYNMIELLALLGPVAAEPAASIQSVSMPNAFVIDAANWAINAPAAFPWLGTGAQWAGMGDPVFAGFVNALGERLRPCALKLAPAIVAGTAGPVPPYGYQILNAAPEDSLRTLLPHLQSPDKPTRQRVTVALGRMGPPAAPARPALQSALAAATDPRERNLLQWSLDQLTDE